MRRREGRATENGKQGGKAAVLFVVQGHRRLLLLRNRRDAIKGEGRRSRRGLSRVPNSSGWARGPIRSDDRGRQKTPRTPQERTKKAALLPRRGPAQEGRLHRGGRGTPPRPPQQVLCVGKPPCRTAPRLGRPPPTCTPRRRAPGGGRTRHDKAVESIEEGAFICCTGATSECEAQDFSGLLAKQTSSHSPVRLRASQAKVRQL